MYKAALLGLLVCAGCSGGAPPAAYPNKTVRLVVGYAPGGSIDVVGRLLAGELTTATGQRFIVENRSGAGSNIANDLVAKAPADGYTLLVGGTALGTNPALYSKLTYDPEKDFQPIIQTVRQANLLVVNPSLPVKSVSELIALARTRSLSYGSGGSGTTQHMSAALFMKMAGIQMTHVPYRGGVPAVTDLVGGQIDLMFAPLPEALAFVQSGQLRAIAVTTAQRSALLADIPTVAESGLAGYELEGWHGVAAPVGTSPEIVTRLNVELNKALASSGVQDKLRGLGLDIVGGPPEVMAGTIRGQVAKMKQLAKDAGVQPVD